MIINHNMGAINAQRNMGINSGTASKSMEKLSSGLRINRAGDDAAGLSISEKMRAQIRGLEKASTNAEDGISMIQTAEGALNETHSILQRMRELSIQSANDTNTDDDRAEIQKEIDQLSDEINRIGNNTEFNTQKLLDGSQGTKTTSADLTGGKALDVSETNKVQILDGKETKNNSISIEYKTSANTIHNITVEMEEGEYDDVIDFTTKFNAALKTAVSTYEVNFGSSIKDKIMDTFKIGVTTETSGVDAGKVKMTITAASAGTASNNDTLTIKGTTANDQMKEIFGNADLTSTKAATNSVATSTSFIKKDQNEITYDKFSVRLEDGKNPEVNQNNELKMNIDGIDIKADIKEGNYTASTTLAKEVKTAISTAINNIQSSDISAEKLAEKGFKGSTALQDYKNSLKQGLQVEFNEDGQMTISAKAEMKIDESTKAAEALGLTNVNSDIKGSGLNLQIGANAGQTITIGIGDMRADALGTEIDGVTKNVSGIDVSTAKGAEEATTVLDAAIKTVSAERSKLGAYQNRLEHTINNLGTSSENLTAAESRIRDTDMASEMSQYSKNNILQQAAQAMLAQAKSAPQQVLQLLQ